MGVALSGANPELADRLFSETLARNRFLLLYRPGDLNESSASLEGAPVSQYHRRQAQPLTMKRCAALFHRGERQVSAAPFLI